MIFLLSLLIFTIGVKLMASQTDVLTALTALKAQVDAIVVAVPVPPEDLQPSLDAIAGVSADLATKFPPAA